MVGDRGFGLLTSRSRTERSDQAELVPEEKMNGAAGGSQTPDQSGRNRPLCSLSYDGKKKRVVARGSFELPISGVKTQRPGPLDERATRERLNEQKKWRSQRDSNPWSVLRQRTMLGHYTMGPEREKW